MKRLLFAGFLLGWIVNSQAQPLPAPAEYRFAVNAPGSFPYLYFDHQQRRYRGLVPRLFRKLQQSENVQVRFVDSSQLRSEAWLDSGQADMLLANPKWLKSPKRLLSSLPLMEHNSYLYSLTPFEADFSLATLRSPIICTRKNFVYTGLSNYFATGKARRLESSSQQAMASMLIHQRCDYAVLNDYNAMQVFNAHQLCDGPQSEITLYQSPHPSSTVTLYILMRPELTTLKQAIDNELTAMLMEDELKQWLDRDAAAPAFPLTLSCDVH